MATSTHPTRGRGGVSLSATTPSSLSSIPEEPKGFLAPPLEIRRQIYRHLLVSEGLYEFWEMIHYPPRNLAEVHSLLLVNRQIYIEAVDIFYGENWFLMRHLSLWDIQTWRKPDNMNRSRRIRRVGFLANPKNTLGISRRKPWGSFLAQLNHARIVAIQPPVPRLTMWMDLAEWTKCLGEELEYFAKHLKTGCYLEVKVQGGNARTLMEQHLSGRYREV